MLLSRRTIRNQDLVRVTLLLCVVGLSLTLVRSWFSSTGMIDRVKDASQVVLSPEEKWRLQKIQLGDPKGQQSVIFTDKETPPLAQDDPRLLSYIRTFHLFPPPRLVNTIKHDEEVHPTFMAEMRGVIKEVLGERKSGFFIEAGANDGEFLSNTLELEVNYGWTGLLVEPSATYFPLLKGNRRRKAWLSDVCLSDRPARLDLYKDTAHEWGSQGGIRLEFGSRDRLDKVRYAWDGKADCVPLGSLLMAMNVTTVDFLSLDVEGNEYKVLKAFPFDQIEIKVILVEWLFIPEGKNALPDFMKTKGYEERQMPNLPNDFLFVKKNEPKASSSSAKANASNEDDQRR